METTSTTVERKTAYERGRLDALKEYRLILSMTIDAYPASPSTQTLALFEEGAAELSVEITKHLERLEKKLRKNSKVEAVA